MRIATVASTLIAAAVLLVASAPAEAQNADPLVERLRAGGYVLAMRHAHSPRGRPDASAASVGNTALERQLDELGRATAVAMGDAIRALGIPVGEVLTSPTYRAVETARHLSVGEPRAIDGLGDGGMGMQADSAGERSALLRRTASERPSGGTNMLIVTHLPNLLGAFGEEAAGMDDGEALVIVPDGSGFTIAARVKIDEWGTFAAD